MILFVVCVIAALFSSTAAQGCAQLSTTLEQKLYLIANDHDRDDNGAVTTDEINYAIDNNFDLDEDGTVTEKECVRYWSCRYGDTQFVATYMCNSISRGMEEIDRSYFDAPPYNTTGMEVTNFKNNFRILYHEFTEEHCVNRFLTVMEKLELNAKANDFNDDSKIGDEDWTNDLANNYDADGDGNVTEYEWVMHRICAFGDEGGFARSMWDKMTGDLPVIPTNFFVTGGEPIPRAEFKANNRETYETYAKEMREKNTFCNGASHLSLPNSLTVITVFTAIFAKLSAY